MPREITSDPVRVRVESCVYRKTKNRQYVPIKGTTFFLNAPSVAAFRRAHALMMAVLEKGEWREAQPGDDEAADLETSEGTPAGV